MSDPVPLPVKARPIALRRDMYADDVFRLVMVACVAHIVANAQALTARDAESLHQMRVALRRTQAALRLFADIFAAPDLAALRLRVKTFAGRLAPARDLDVLIDETLEPMAQAIGPAAVESLRRRAEPMQTAAWNDAVAAIEDPAFAALIADLAAAGHRHRWAMHVLSAKTLAKAALDDFLRTVRRRGRRFDGLNSRERHRLRVAIKHMRYAAEIFASLYKKKKKTRRYIAALRRLQDGLGDLNDTEQLALGVPTSQAGRIAAYRRQRSDRLFVEVRHAWRTFEKQKPFWK